jgi:nucleotide-binding universal stress UspA family protein
MYNKILVPLDGSELSECSLPHVQAIALGCKAAKVVLLRVLEPLYLGGTVMAELGEEEVKSLGKKSQEAAIKYLAEQAKKLENAGIKVEPAITSGNAANVILDYASKQNIDLIIMSTHGSSGIIRFMVGSVADKIIRHSSAPVLLVAPSSCRLPA